MIRSAFLMMLWVISSCAFGQAVFQAQSAQLQPQIGRDEGGYSSCGVRALVVTASADYLYAYDFSAMVRFDVPYGTLKAGKSRTPVRQAQAGKFNPEVILPPPVKFWFVKENEGKPVSPIKIIPSESKGYILALADLAGTIDGIFGMVDGERMQFAIRYKNEPVDSVISFSANMSDQERIPLLKCIEGVIERMK